MERRETKIIDDMINEEMVLKMGDILYTKIEDKTYIGIITVMDYETCILKWLSVEIVGVKNDSRRKVIIDLILKQGDNKYRFVSCDIDDDGRLLYNTCINIHPNDKILHIADIIIRERPIIV